MKALKGTKTHDNLKAAFAGESQANRRYLYFANKADVEGQNDVAALFRSTAEGETGHAHGHLDYLDARSATRRPTCRSARIAPEPEGRGRGRDARVHRHVPGHGEDGARRGLRRDRRLVRDAGEGRALAREPLPEGAGRAGGLGVESGTTRLRAACLSALGSRGRPRGFRARSADDPRGLGAGSRPDHARRQPRSAHAPPARLAQSRVLRRGGAPQGDGARLRHLPRLPPLRQPVPVVPDALRPGRRKRDRRGRRGGQEGLRARSSTSATCATSAT